MFMRHPPGKLTLPTADMELFGTTFIEAAGDSLKAATGIDFYNPKTGNGWVLLKQNSLFDKPELEGVDGTRVMYVVFSGLLPEQVDLKSDFEWVSLCTIMSSQNILDMDKEIVLQAASKI